MYIYKVKSIIKFLSLNQVKFLVLKTLKKNIEKIQRRQKFIKKFPIIVATGSAANKIIIKLSFKSNFFDIIIEIIKYFYIDF